MKIFISFYVFSLFCISSAFCQDAVLSGILRDSISGDPVIGATIRIENTMYGAKSNSNGFFHLPKVEAGTYELSVKANGFESLLRQVILQANDSMYLVITLHPHHTEGEEIVITGTRTMRSIADVPVRVEVIPEEELQEKVMMEASSVSMALNETPGIRVQASSSSSNASNIRIQGLQGRYTEILVDGIPNLGGLSAELGLTQMPPLNLRQIEVIKGASSVLYGADAIAGVVNFLTKTPRAQADLSALVNITNQKAQDAALFYANTFDKVGLTFFSSYDHQGEFDVNGDNFSDIAAYKRINISPQFFYAFSKDISAKLGFGFMDESRRGGVMNTPNSAIGKPAPYLEENQSRKYYGTGNVEWNTNETSQFSANSAAMQFSRNAHYGATKFDGLQTVLYADAQYAFSIADHSLLFGAAYYSDRFTDKTNRLAEPLDYFYSVPGFFVQDEWAVAEGWKILAGVRADAQNVYGLFVTPRASLFFKPSENITLRLGGGGGFKAPTPFVEEAEEIGYKDIRSFHSLLAERAQSFSCDANWKAVLGDFGLTMNAALFYTALQNALVVNEDSIEQKIITLENSTGQTITRGAELLAQLSYEDFKLSFGYSYTFATQNHRGSEYELELNPRHNLGIVFMFEDDEDGWKGGIESYYIGKQKVERNPFRTTSPSYWILGALIEKNFGKFRIYLNSENLLDIKQTDYDPAFIGDPFVSGKFEMLHVYAPLEGRTINGGIRFIL